jgi:glutathione S-transferase
MITLHHLNNSRSQRVLWMLEELGCEYRIAFHQRDAVTNLAPPELERVHPLGKSPVIEVDGRVIAESGAILEYLAATRADGRLAVAPSHAAWADYLQWLHYAEGSAMLPLMLQLYVGRLGDAGAPLQPRIDSELNRHLGFMDASLAGRDFLVDGRLTAADINNSFVLEAARARGRLATLPNLARVLAAWQARPAYLRALEKGGAYAFGPAANP